MLVKNSATSPTAIPWHQDVRRFKNILLSGHQGVVRNLAWSPNDEALATGGVDHSVRVWSAQLMNAASQAVSNSLELKGHVDEVKYLSWNPQSSSYLASVSSDRNMLVWDVRSQKTSSKVGLASEGFILSWSPNGEVLCVGDCDDLLTFYDVKTLQPIQSKKYERQANEFLWTSDMRHFIIATSDGAVDMYAWPDLSKPVHTIVGHTAAAYALDYDHEHSRLLVGGADAVASLWNLEDDPWCEKSYGKTEYALRSVSFSHDFSAFAVGSHDEALEVFAIDTGVSLLTMALPAAISCVRWSHGNVPMPRIAVATDVPRPRNDGRNDASKKPVVIVMQPSLDRSK
eukprot:Plantae.Rhodophyta-Rhodochaete_pulchella.ctg3021.p1 GENE.Plantae.Rhodophyta-Rhodochaete_pulchella.ctg3021~~Plantae.Rhodophyta-Rhodochaete_pulchella.ctg3021.p1  ORF type:complete len:343 (-),score=38.45 Plantae.Rhodophyta-Rhodochaete_pulchella.ctg3021:685-1713(-)